MIKIKLELQKLADEEVVGRLTLVAGKLAGNATFPEVPVPSDTLTADASAMSDLLSQRQALLEQAQQLTLQIRTARNKAEADLNQDAGYVEGVINKIVPPATSVDPVVAAEKARSAGMDVAAERTPVGPMPKIDGLTVTQGDSDGELDLTWNPIKRGLNSYEGELTEDVAGQTGWEHSFTAGRSKTEVTGLTSGKRYWFRVRAHGAAGPGPWSEPATKVAP